MTKALFGFTLEEIENIVLSFGDKKFRAKQIFESFAKNKTIDEITVLPNTLIQKFKDNNYTLYPVSILKKLKSKDKRTIKYLILLNDHNIVEAVSMKYKYGTTLCLSTQIGCKMGCSFCASTLGGCKRNLTDIEMLAQVFLIEADLKEERNTKEQNIKNIVLMGSGEPLDNYDNVVSFINKLLNDYPDNFQMSKRGITLSTVGLVDKMDKFIKEDLGIILAFSMHAPNDEIRKKIIHSAHKYKVDDMLSKMNEYIKASGRRAIIEYSLIKDINDSEECAIELANKLKGMKVHVNLIRLNSVKERKLFCSSKEQVKRFQDILERKGISVTLRSSMGADIQGACGQLRRSYLDKE